MDACFFFTCVHRAVQLQRLLRRFETVGTGVTSAIRGDLNKVDEKIGGRIDKLDARLSSAVESFRASHDKTKAQGLREHAHFLQTVEKLIQNLANQATDLKHAAPMQTLASELGAKARAVESANLSAAVNEPPPLLAAAQAGSRTRGREPDPDGFKLSHLPANNFDNYSPQLKAIYLARDNVATSEQFQAIGDRTCVNCAADAPNMKHREKHCTTAFGTCPEAQVKLGKVRAARAQQRVLTNFDRLVAGKPATAYALLAVAEALDADGDDGGGHYDAFVHMAAFAPCDVDDDTDADFIINAADMICQLGSLYGGRE